MPKKRILMGMVICVLMISISVVIITDKTSSRVVTKSDTSSDNEVSSLFAIMLETEAGSGEYQASDNTTWPQEGYTYNETLSACENGSTLIWNEENKTVRLQANISDKCYVYFDVYVEPPILAEYIIKNVYTADGEDGLYYHDGEGTYTNATYEAGDNSYRYSGASAEVNNYVCFGSTADTCPDDNLYRIIGVFDDDGDGTYNVKLIKYDYATSDLLGEDGDYFSTYAEGGRTVSDSYLGDTTKVGIYSWNDKTTRVIDETTYRNIWSDSELNKVNLNTNFLNNIGEAWSSLIENYTWKVAGTANKGSLNYGGAYYYYLDEVLNPDSDIEEEITAKVGLMYISDYAYAAASSYWRTNISMYSNATDDNWMYMGLYEWTITRTTGNAAVFGWSYSGSAIVTYSYVYGDGSQYGIYAVRPVFYLNSDVKYVSGDGTYDNPFRIA